MPIYEYYCPDNHTLYSFFSRRLHTDERVPRCPDDPALRLEKRVSSFAVVRRRGDEGSDEAGDDPLSGLDEGQIERLMGSLEAEMGGMDEENADPQSLGRAMRKFFSALGRKPPAAMEEMLSRLEAGEDPETVEAEFGPALEGEDALFGDPATAPARMREMLERLRGPRRDPQLYELSDYL